MRAELNSRFCEGKRRDTGGGGGRRVWDEWRMESNMEAYILPCIKQITNGNLLCDSRNSNQGSVTT